MFHTCSCHFAIWNVGNRWCMGERAVVYMCILKFSFRHYGRDEHFPHIYRSRDGIGGGVGKETRSTLVAVIL